MRLCSLSTRISRKTSMVRSLVFIAISGLMLAGCAVGPKDSAERGRNFWDLASIFSTPKDEITPVDDPSLEESEPEVVEKRVQGGSLRDIPLIGPLLATLFSSPPQRSRPAQQGPLPEDEELAEDTKGQSQQSQQRPSAQRVRLTIPRYENDRLLADREAPRIKVFHVRNGRLHASRNTITIRGLAEDASGIVSLRLNGNPIPIRTRVFSKKVRIPIGVHQALIEAEDTAGNKAYFQFKLVRRAARQNAKHLHGEWDKRYIRPAPEQAPPPQVAAMREPGIYMVLMAGSASAHIVKMPNLRKCREAVLYSNNAACTYHMGAQLSSRIGPS